MSFEIKPNDLIGENKENKEHDLNLKSYMKNGVETFKLVKSFMNESLGVLGLDLKDVKNLVNERINGKTGFVNASYVETPAPINKVQKKQNVVVRDVKENKEKMEKLDLEKIVLKLEKVIKLMGAADKSPAEFLEQLFLGCLDTDIKNKNISEVLQLLKSKKNELEDLFN